MQTLIYGSTNIKKLQHVQTSFARVVLPNLSQQPATTLLSELHWLPGNSRITFKLACLTYKLLTTHNSYIERLECEVLQKVRYINTLTFTFTFICARYDTITALHALCSWLVNSSLMCLDFPLNL